MGVVTRLVKYGHAFRDIGIHLFLYMNYYSFFCCQFYLYTNKIYRIYLFLKHFATISFLFHFSVLKSLKNFTFETIQNHAE